MYYPNGKEMDQMVRNDIACNCIPLERIAFLVCMHFILIAFWMIFIPYLHRYHAYLYCWKTQMKCRIMRISLFAINDYDIKQY